MSSEVWYILTLGLLCLLVKQVLWPLFTIYFCRCYLLLSLEDTAMWRPNYRLWHFQTLMESNNFYLKTIRYFTEVMRTWRIIELRRRHEACDVSWCYFLRQSRLQDIRRHWRPHCRSWETLKYALASLCDDNGNVIILQYGLQLDRNMLHHTIQDIPRTW